MAYEEATAVINDIHMQLAMLARNIVSALDDNKVSTFEAMSIGMRGMSTASAIMGMFRLTSPEVRKDILYVLERGQWTMPVLAARHE